LEKTDGSRPVVPHSGILPHPPQLDGTDSHWYVGWYHGNERDFPRLLRWWPRVARFVSEFGAQALPDDAGFLEPDRWPDLDWERAYRRHGLQKPFFDEHVQPAAYATFEAWQSATQRYQAELIRHHVHALRLLKYRPTGGFAQFCLADSHPAVTGSVLGHDRTPKPGYASLQAACAPVIVLAGRLAETLHADEPLTIPVYAINDRRISFSDMVVTLHLHWSWHGTTQHLQWRWQGELPADCATRVGLIDTTVPAADGHLAVRVELHDADGQRVDHYDDRAPVRT
jgi:beta-mannosidase